MKINENLVEIKKVTELISKLPFMQSFFSHCGTDGVLYKATLDQLATFLAPYITAVGGSGFVATTGTVLPAASAGKFTIVGAGTFTQTTGGNVVTTEFLNILASSATTWSLATAISSNALVSKDFSDFGGRFATIADANTAIPNTVVNGKNQRSGKIVFIGTDTDYVAYWWKGGFADSNLVKYIALPEAITRDEFLDPLSKPNLNNGVSIGKYYTGTSPLALADDVRYGAINVISANPSSTFALQGIVNSLTNSSQGRCYDINNNLLASISINNFAVITGGYKLTLPATTGIAKVGLHFNADEAPSIIIQSGSEIIKDRKIKKSYIPKLYTSELDNDANFLTDLTGVLSQEILEYEVPANLVTSKTQGFYYKDASPVTLFPDPLYGYINLIKVTPGSTYAVGGMVNSISNNSIGRFYDIYSNKLSNITPSSFVAISDGYKITVPATASILYMGLHFSVGELANITVQSGALVVRELKVKKSKIPQLETSDLVNNSDFGTESDISSNSLFIRGKAKKIYVPKKYGIIVAGQSQLNGRIDYTELPQEFKDAATLFGSTYSLSGTNYWNTDVGPFTGYTVANNAQWGWDLYLYLYLRNYVRTKTGNASEEIYIIKDSLGGTSIDPNGEAVASGMWSPFFENILNTKTALLKRFEKRIRTANTDTALFDIRCFVWDQGEGDRGETVAPLYYQNLKNLIAYVRGVVDNPRLPVILVGANTSNLQYSPIVDAAKRRLASEDYFIHYVEVANGTQYMKDDQIHVNALGGKDRADKTLALIKDIVPQTNVLGGALS